MSRKEKINKTKNKMENKQYQGRPFRMLIGDDAYVDKRNAEISLSVMMCGLAEVTGIPCIEGEIIDGVYSTPEFPIKEFTGAEIRVASSVDEMIRESSGNYDWIVTDYNYGPGYSDGGRTILANQGIRNNPAVKSVFTSESNPKTLEGLANIGADLVVSPVLRKTNEHKLTLLGKEIANFYNNGGK